KAARTNTKRQNLRNILPIIEIILFYQTLHVAHNAQLSGEQRTDQATALHRKALYLTHSKTATR
uniref:hypothetical protein n=1 Tax=Vibrio sp. S12_S33 TaxID=2720223 RepID=UPI001EE1F4B2